MWIMNICLIAAIQFQGTLHGFHTCIGTCTASFESNMIHQMIAMRDEVVYEICLDLHKSYDALDRGHCLDILKEYGIFPGCCAYSDNNGITS